MGTDSSRRSSSPSRSGRPCSTLRRETPRRPWWPGHRECPGDPAVEVDAELYDPIIQALGVVAARRATTDAEQFARFVLEQDGPGILKEFGFAVPGESSALPGGMAAGGEVEPP